MSEVKGILQKLFNRAIKLGGLVVYSERSKIEALDEAETKINKLIAKEKEQKQIAVDLLLRQIEEKDKEIEILKIEMSRIVELNKELEKKLGD